MRLKKNRPKCSHNPLFVKRIHNLNHGKSSPIFGATFAIFNTYLKVNNRSLCRRKFAQSGHPTSLAEEEIENFFKEKMGSASLSQMSLHHRNLRLH
jgi:hypothetical protein